MAPLQPAARRPAAFLLVILVAVFTFLAIRSEINDRAIDKNSERLESVIVTQCEDRNTAAMATNKVLDKLIAVNQTVTTLPAAEIRDRIALYNSVKVPIVNCAR